MMEVQGSLLVDERSAEFSKDGVYRYSLTRTWDRGLPPLMVVGMNPSTADATQDDPTIRRCIRFARDWGYGGLLMANLFAFRATDPKDMPTLRERPLRCSPVGELGDRLQPGGYREQIGDRWLRDMAKCAGLILAAWGSITEPYGWEGRARDVRRLLSPRLHALGFTRDGSPRHPLYVAADTRPVPMPLDKDS